ncbi:hypothetical protein ANCCAN_19091 [Ancylostoma caninum]|uniref:Uncharacterized protein n=1 Tax=Ancylostoma caninum TaxID=29170 RepID=A0A368FWA2_ANCCA|nr:hypothetical protein ANCCAN_19091 [Ancylostoma caninum]
MEGVERPPGILANALWEIRTQQNGKSIDAIIRPKSADDVETKGMIGLLLETQDERELENLGLKDLMSNNVRRPPTAAKRPPSEEEVPPTPKKMFVPKMKSRESTSSSEEQKRPSPPVSKTTLTRVSPKEGSPLPTKTAPPPYNQNSDSQEEQSQEKKEPDPSEAEIDLSMADPQTKVLYMAKHEQWPTIDAELDQIKKNDFSLADQIHCFAIVSSNNAIVFLNDYFSTKTSAVMQ